MSQRLTRLGHKPFKWLSISLTWPIHLSTPTLVSLIHIGILDTARLDPANVVLHVGDFARVCQARGQRADNREFLVFGVIKGECYKAVPCREFLVYQTYSPNARVQPTMKGVIKIAQLFGKNMELATAASLTTLPGTYYGDRQTLLAQLSALHLPKEEWHDDPKLARSSEVDYHGSQEAEYAAKLIRRLIDIVEGEEPHADVEPPLSPSIFPGNPAPQLPLLDVEEDQLKFVRDSEREEAQAALDAGTSIRDVDDVLARSRRKAFLEDKSVPRELKNLQTTMSGCHGVVEAHWKIHTKGRYPYDEQAAEYLDAPKMQQLAETTPRYLFRAWSAESGGDPQLNTVNAITPRAFHRGAAPTTLFAATKNEIAELVQLHLHYVDTGKPTIFSSWSQSLAFALHIACNFVETGRTNIHISVTDTTKLDQDVLAIHSGYLCRETLLLPAQLADQYEYLTFGVVKRPAHTSVSLSSMQEAGYEKMFLPQWMEDAEHKKMIIDIIKCVSRLFGDDLELLVSSHFVADMSRQLQMNESEMLSALSGLKLPGNWGDDSKLTTTGRDTVHGFHGPPLAAKLIRNIIRMSKGLEMEAEGRRDLD